jgi:HD-like signal output (HDOD) protein
MNDAGKKITTQSEARQKADARPAGLTGPAVEVLASQIPSVQKILASLVAKKEPSPFARFISDVYPFVHMPKTAQFILDAFSSRDVTAEKISGALKNNPSIEQVFFQVIESFGKRTDIPSLEAAVVLIGMQNSRNLIVATQLLRSMGLALEWSPEGKLKTIASDYLKYALKTEESVAGAGGVNAKAEHADLAFSAGIFFDVFVLIASRPEYAERKKKLLAYIEEIYTQSLKTASIAVEVVKIVPELGYQRLFFAAALLHDVGKIALAFSEPGYQEFSEQVAKKGLNRHIRRFAEAKRFGVNHSVLGAVICYSYTPFSAFARAILYQHEPFLLSTRRKNIYKLTAVVSLCTNIAAQFKKTDKVEDPILGVWKGPELKDLKIDNAQLLQALARVK